MRSKPCVNFINCNNQEFWNIKLSKFLTTLSLTATLATAQMVGLPNQKPKEAQAQSNRPYVVLVNGSISGCQTKNGKLFAVTQNNKLWVRDPVLSDVAWTNIGHAENVVAMTAVNGKLFAVTP